MIDDETIAVADLSAGEVLRAIGVNQREVWAREAQNLALAAHWADLHPPLSMDSAAAFSNLEVGGTYAEQEEPISGPGCPGVAEFCIAPLND